MKIPWRENAVAKVSAKDAKSAEAKINYFYPFGLDK